MFFFTVITIFLFASTTTAAKNRLLLVQTVWNSGSHTPPIDLWTTNISSLHQQSNMSILTNSGAEQLYRLGEHISDRYIRGFQIFNEANLPNSVHSIASNVELQLTSSYVVGLGMQGNRSGQYWPNAVRTEIDDDYLRWNSLCPNAVAIMRTQLIKASWFQSTSTRQFLDDIFNKTGYNCFDGLDRMYLLWDALNAMHKTNRSSISSADIDRLKSLVDVGAAVSYNHPTVARLRGGPLLKVIIDRFRNKIQCNENKHKSSDCGKLKPLKMFTYSTDDLTQFALLASLGIIESELPRAASAVSIELWQNVFGDYEINAIAQLDNTDRWADLAIGGCEDLVCKFDDFVARSRPYLATNRAGECGIASEQQTALTDCDERDLSEEKNCRDWAVADYCTTQLAVRYLFCRQTCLCNGRRYLRTI